MGKITNLLDRLKLAKNGPKVRALYKEGIVEANGESTIYGRKLARRMIADTWLDENKDTLADQLIEAAKLEKEESAK